MQYPGSNLIPLANLRKNEDALKGTVEAAQQALKKAEEVCSRRNWLFFVNKRRLYNLLHINYKFRAVDLFLRGLGTHIKKLVKYCFHFAHFRSDMSCLRLMHRKKLKRKRFLYSYVVNRRQRQYGNCRRSRTVQK